jgi:DNA-binding transcriptional LysR family regulator
MNIALIKTFLEIVEAKNLQKAAKRLHVTQSTVTVRLNTLEDLLGQRLFIRNKSGAELTYAGFMFHRYAEMFLQLWQQARQSISLPPGFNCMVNIGFETDLWEKLTRPWLLAMRENLPTVAIGMWPGDPEALSRWLSSGLVDLALTFGVQMKAGIEVDPLYEEELVLVSTTPRNFSQDDLGTRWVDDYVFVDRGDELRQQHALHFPAQTVPALTFGGEHVALDYLLDRGGYAYLSARTAAPHLDSGRLFEVSNHPPLSRPVYLARGSAARQCIELPRAEALLHELVSDDFGKREATDV